MNDPLSALANSPASASSQPSSSAADSVFRTIDVSKMKAPLPAKGGASTDRRAPTSSSPNEVDRQVMQQTTGAGKGLGFGVDLWGSASLDSHKSNRGGDLLSEASFPVADAGIFQKTSGVAPAPAPTSSTAVKTVRVGSELDDFKLDDLKVSERLLEREEELDFATFGKASHAVQLNQRTVIATVQAGRDKGDFELESSEMLAKLEAATLEGDKSSAFRMSAPTAADEPAPKSIEVDLATLDLDSYIKQQEETGGGLFD